MAKSDPKKKAALEALLNSKTFTEAAEKAGISRKTLYSYIRDDLDFATAYKAAQEQITLERMEEASDARQRALDAITDLMTDTKQPGAVRLKAAISLLEAADAQRERGYSLVKSNVDRNTPIDFDPFGILGKGS